MNIHGCFQLSLNIKRNAHQYEHKYSPFTYSNYTATDWLPDLIRLNVLDTMHVGVVIIEGIIFEGQGEIKSRRYMVKSLSTESLMVKTSKI